MAVALLFSSLMRATQASAASFFTVCCVPAFGRKARSPSCVHTCVRANVCSTIRSLSMISHRLSLWNRCELTDVCHLCERRKAVHHKAAHQLAVHGIGHHPPPEISSDSRRRHDRDPHVESSLRLPKNQPNIFDAQSHPAFLTYGLDNGLSKGAACGVRITRVHMAPIRIRGESPKARMRSSWTAAFP
jgi:hypothetical protein